MEISPIHRTIDAKALAPEQLASNEKLPEKEKLAAACQQFEAVLLRQILDQSMKPAFASSMVHDSATSGIYRDWMTGALAENVSRSGAFGLASMFESQLSRPETTKSKAETGLK